MKFKKIPAFIMSAVIAMITFGFAPEKIMIIQKETVEAMASEYTAAQGAAWAGARADESWCQDVDGEGSCQCVDLTKAYFKYLEGYMPKGYAYEYMTISLPAGWQRIPEGSGTPQPGDIIVWNSYAHGFKENGHVGIVEYVNADGKTWGTVETNVDSPYNGGPAKRQPRWNYSCLIRPNFMPDRITGHVMTEDEAVGQTIPDGDYWIISKLDMNYYLDVPGNGINNNSGIALNYPQIQLINLS